MRRVAQSAVEYMFMLAASLVMVLFVIDVVFQVVRGIDRAVLNYITSVRKQVLENL